MADCEALFRVAEVAIDSLQTASTTFTSSIAWPTVSWDWMSDFTKIRLALEGTSYVAIYLTCTCGVLAFALLGGLMAAFELPCEPLMEALWFTFGEAVMFGILFIPLMTNLFEIFNW